MQFQFTQAAGDWSVVFAKQLYRCADGRPLPRVGKIVPLVGMLTMTEVTEMEGDTILSAKKKAKKIRSEWKIAPMVAVGGGVKMAEDMGVVICIVPARCEGDIVRYCAQMDQNVLSEDALPPDGAMDVSGETESPTVN